MAIVRPGRVVPAAAAARARRVEATPMGAQPAAHEATTTVPFAQVVPPDVVAAHRRAAEVAEQARERGLAQARADADARLAAAWLALRAREERAAEADLERAIGLAKVLAERLVGGELAIAPDKVVDLARAALAEARGARRVRIQANPLDADALRGHLEEVGLPAQSVEVDVDPQLARGALVLHTDLGTVDARLQPQLERLAQALRTVLRA